MKKKISIDSLIAFFAYSGVIWGSFNVLRETIKYEHWRPSIISGILILLFTYLIIRLFINRDKPWNRLTRVLSLLLFVGLIPGLPYLSMCMLVYNKKIMRQPIIYLSEMRQNITIYIDENGTIPSDLSQVVSEIPVVYLFPTAIKIHEVRVSAFPEILNSGKWLYITDKSSPTVIIDSTDLSWKGRPWSSY